jgi:hypothetical protein
MESDEVDMHLAAVRIGQSAAADRLVTPWWYHPIRGLLLAGVTLAYGIGSRWVAMATVAIFFAGMIALATAYRNQTGVWVSGFNAGGASRWAYALGALAFACLAAAGVARYVHHTTWATWATWATAVVAAVGTVLIGRRFDASLRERIRRGE